MKILEMRLTAYGPFSGEVVDLSQGKEGLHVIYGPNEAGKSSALRALRHLLYGIPVQSVDDFIHPYTKMRIGAIIQAVNGDRLDFVRRKGRSNTLRAADDSTVIEDAVLQQFLNSVDAALFETMFGIGYTDLVRGGREIVKGGGNLGQLIFSAASGITNLREIQTDLQSEADALFRPSGSRPIINAAIGQIKNNRKEMRDAMLPGREWRLHDQALRRARKRIPTVEAELAGNNRDLHRLQRVRDALPLIAKRRELIEEHAKYASAVLLPQAFPEKRRILVTDLGVSRSSRDQALKNIEAAQKAMADLEISDAILDKSEPIEALYRELGSQHKAARDRIKLQTMMSGLRGEAREILRGLRDDLTVDDAEKLRLKKPQAIRIRELGAEYERINTRIDTAGEAIPKLVRRISDLDGQLKNIRPPGEIEDLKIAVLGADETVAVEKQCRRELLEIQTAEKSLEVKLDKQTLWSGPLAELESLPVPPGETINRFEERIGETERNYAGRKEEVEKLEHNLADIERRIEELRLQQEVPTEEDLHKARDLRDRGWQHVVDRMEGRRPDEAQIDCFLSELKASGTLAEAFQVSLLQADEISDRLRREADRVAAKARLLADQAAIKRQLDRSRSGLENARNVKEDLVNEWIELWRPCGITPRSPKEMQAWVRDHLAMAERAGEIREKKTRIAALQKEVEACAAALNQRLQLFAEPPAPGATILGDLVQRARRIIEKEEEIHRKTEVLTNEKAAREQELAETKLKVESSEKELRQWQTHWEEAVRPLGLDAGSNPSQANAVMDELKDLFDKLKEAVILQKRIEGIDRDAAQFEKMVAGLVDAMAGDLVDRPAAEAAAELNSRLTRARSIQSKRQTLREQLKKDQDLFNRAFGRIAEVETRLKGMVEEAGCTNHDDLPEAERRSEKRRQIEVELKNLDERLLQLSAGSTIEGFIDEALKVDPDGIDGETDRLQEEIDKLNQEKSELNRTIGREESELGKMDGSTRAAELAEEIQMQLGRLENDIEHYSRLRIAARVLNQAIERYRDKSQGPVLNRATEFFKQITRGSFEGIRAEFDHNGQPVLVGVRPGGNDIVAVDGMSDGTADQLYLALRLAGLEDYLDKNEPMPFIVDDILIKFDDERATAALQVLADISKKTQIIFFTHHRHLVDLAESHVDSSVLIRHELKA